MTDLDLFRLQGRTILRPGDFVRIDSGQARFLVQRIVETSSGVVEVHAYGGKPGRLTGRVFRAEAVTRCRSPKDPNELWRVALEEVSKASKKRKAGRR